jgi:uncharacterized protein YyaL (SSP411 family)
VSTATTSGDAERVCWRPWSGDVFSQARAEGKRVLLSISASWCHWCHVMDEESFAHPEVIRQLNNRFIPVRVDSDQRPDINSRYNMGGWPTVAVLDEEGRVIAGETYLPLGSFLAWLESAARAQAPFPHQVTVPRPVPAAPALDHALVMSVADWLERAYDPTFGGFGRAPKFPQPSAVELLFRLHARTGEARWRSMAIKTLDAMREGELCDPIDGGFFRYATSDDWSAPHTEKLLDVNARLLSLYLEAYRVTNTVSYRTTAQEIEGYLLSTLMVEAPAVNGPAGGVWFGGSQAADRDYYHGSQEERLEAEPPLIDRTLYLDRNAMAASALLAAGGMLQKPDDRELGLTLLEFLWTHGQSPDGGMTHYGDGGVNIRRMTGGYLTDQVWLLCALLDGCETAGRQPWLDRAETLASALTRRWWDGQSGGFWDLPVDLAGENTGEPAGLLRVRLKPLVENAVAAIGLTRLARLTGNAQYRRLAEQTLRALVPLIGEYRRHAAPFGVALDYFLSSGAADHEMKTMEERAIQDRPTEDRSTEDRSKGPGDRR